MCRPTAGSQRAALLLFLLLLVVRQSQPVSRQTSNSPLAASSVADFVLAVLPWFILWDLQIKPKEKALIAAAMSLGLMYAIPTFIINDTANVYQRYGLRDSENCYPETVDCKIRLLL
jgi:hypothetical protein